MGKYQVLLPALGMREHQGERRKAPVWATKGAGFWVIFRNYNSLFKGQTQFFTSVCVGNTKVRTNNVRAICRNPIKVK